MKAFSVILSVALAAFFVSGEAAAQQKRDTVILKKKVAGSKEVSGRVMTEDWKTVEVDTRGEGRADKSFAAEDVDHIEYNKQRLPRYMEEARLSKTAVPPRLKEYLDTLSRSYNDSDTPPCILQHAYHDIATTETEMSKTDAAMVDKAIKAWQELFARVPDTVFAITGRIEFANFLVAQGKYDVALKVLNELANDKYGAKTVQDARMTMARTELAAKRYPEAEKLLTQVASGIKMDDVEALQQVKMLQCRSIIGQKRLEDAYAIITAVLGEKTTPKTLGMLYGVMGDYFAAKGNLKAALTAYLKVPLMYPESDPVEKSQAIKGACSMLDRLGRGKEIETVKKLAGD